MKVVKVGNVENEWIMSWRGFGLIYFDERLCVFWIRG